MFLKISPKSRNSSYNHGRDTRRRALVPLAVLATTLGLVAFSSSSIGRTSSDTSVGSKGTVKIGVLAPITGPLAPYGVAMKRGMEVAVDLINADGGFGGRKVEYTLLDDQTDPKTAATQARRLLLSDHVDLLMGTTSSAATLATIPQAEAAKKPFIYVAEGEDKTCTKNGGTRPLIFGNGETPEQKMSKYVPYMLKHLGKQVYFIGSDYVFPHFVNQITEKLVKDDGGTVVGTNYAPLGTTDFSSYIARIKSAKPDVIFVDVVGSDGVALVKQLTQFGLNGAKITGMPTFAPEVIAGFADVAKGSFTVDRYWEGLQNPVNQKYVAAYKAKFPNALPVPTMAAVGTYGTLLLYKAAIEKAGSIDGEAVAKALSGITVDSPAGKLTVNPANHIITGPEYLLQVTANPPGYKLIEDLGEVPHPDHSGCSSGGI
jgi:ABC-type branched-subunit amino acid transport system substrate-binding protein